MSTDVSPRKVKKLSDTDRLADYDIATQKALEEIDSIQNELDTINEKASAEILMVEQKYNQIRKPYLSKRNQIISGIPNFWVTAIMNHPELSSLLDGSEEEDCLHHLNKIEVEEFEDIRSGYYIKFYFDENPYFENAVLTKEYHFGDGAPMSKNTPIIWKDGAQLGQQAENKTGRKRRIEAMKHSFFSWFTDNVDPHTDDIGEDFKDDLWLNPLQYYLVADGQEEENGIDGDEESSSDEDGDEAGEEENQSTSSAQRK